jgi:hypothetical protein
MKSICSVLCAVFLLLGPNSGIAQLNPDSLGHDDNPMLNEMEARYFNIQALHYRGEFDFSGKKVGLFMEKNGKHMVSKKEYFDNWAREHLNKKDFGQNQLFVLSKEEKELSNGFDAFIVSWSDKQITEKRKQHLVRKLRTFRKVSEVKQTPF